MPSDRAVSTVFSGAMPSFFCRASVSSRTLSQPWSNCPLNLAIQSFDAWCGAWLLPGAKERRKGLLWGGAWRRADQVEGGAGQVADQDVVRVAEWRQHRNVVLEQRRVKLVRVAAKKPVEVVEAQPAGPLVVGPAGTLHPLRNQVVLAEPRRVVTVVDENVPDGADTLGDERGIARITRGELRDAGHATGVVVAAGQQCSPSR